MYYFFILGLSLYTVRTLRIAIFWMHNKYKWASIWQCNSYNFSIGSPHDIFRACIIMSSWKPLSLEVVPQT